jgi:hypothetical protein
LVADDTNPHFFCPFFKKISFGKTHLQKTAGRGVKFVYNTPSGVHYKIDPRLAAPDHWYMMMEGHDPDVSYETLKYFRRRSTNTGPVEFHNHNHTRVASFECEFLVLSLQSYQSMSSLNIDFFSFLYC